MEKFLKSKGAKTGLVVLLFAVYILFTQMNLNPLYPESAFAYCVFFSALVLVWALDKLGSFGVNAASGSPQVYFNQKAHMPKWPFVLLGIVWGMYLIAQIGSSVLFNVNRYRDQMGDLEKVSFVEDFNAVDTSQLPIVDRDMAVNLADKKLGERPSLGSQVVLGEPTLQQVNGELVWAVPTLHSGFFKWLTNMSGTPGYVLVSATNPQSVEYVDGYNLKYQPGAYFFDNLTFHARFGEALFRGITDYSFELDDSGKPYWVISTYKNTCFFALPEATGAIIMDCATGEATAYDIASLPAWVDRIQPENFIMAQLNNQGQYVHGYLNFSDKDKYETSDNSAILYNNGRCYLYTCLTSVGSDESSIGFVMIDMVTKQPKYYQISGATEYAAQLSAEGKVQQYRYRAAFPLIVNLNGNPTYFMTLKDSEGLIKQYAYVSVSDYQTVGVGENISEAKLNFEKAMRSTGNQLVGNTNTEAKTLTAAVARIGSEFNGTSTAYYIVLEGHTDLLLTAQGALSGELSVTQAGDRVTVTYFPQESATQDVTGFDNLEIG